MPFRPHLARVAGIVMFYVTAGTGVAFGQNLGGTPSPWGDQGDGTYRNPILPGDFSDPDVIRVGTDFYLITSTFQYAPGMAILHSKDLVNWRYLSHCVSDVSQLGTELNWDRMNRYGFGIWAGSIRYHDGRFWVVFTTFNEGIFMTTAKDPAGPWEPVHRVSDRANLDDTCPFWDDDGRAYLLYSTPGKQWVTHLCAMSPDARSVNFSSDTVVDPFQTSEGNKLYKIKGTYYVFHNEVRGNRNRVGVFLRSKSLAGPWEMREVLHGAPPTRDREPNQGGLVDAPDGSWWFITQQGQGGSYDGRPCSLLPVAWVDGWPIPGTVDASGAGNIPWSAKKPIIGFPPSTPQSDDEFDVTALGPQWEWNYQPKPGSWSLTDRPGFIRLHAVRPLKPNNLLKIPDLLTQRVMGLGGGTATAKLDVAGMVDGQQAGLCVYADTWSMIGIVQRGGKRSIVYNGSGKQIVPGPGLTGDLIWVRAVLDEQGLAHAKFSLDGTTFTPIGEPYRMRWAHYRGARLGLYTFNDDRDAGHVDVDWFRYAYAGQHAAVPNLQ